MKNIIILLLAFITVVPKLANGDINYNNERCSGIWANNAKLPFINEDNTLQNIISPDGVYSINASSKGLSLINKGISLPLNVLVNRYLTEVLWAPDSRKFAINVSDGGLVGSWETYIYSINDSGQPILLNIQSQIMRISNKNLQCEPGEVSNIGVVAWLNNSKEILLIAEVPPHSSCKNMGAITGFRISIRNGEIIERISEVEFRKKWGKILGCRFLKK